MSHSLEVKMFEVLMIVSIKINVFLDVTQSVVMAGSLLQ
jgi:hypothetical protein